MHSGPSGTPSKPIAPSPRQHHQPTMPPPGVCGGGERGKRTRRVGAASLPSVGKPTASRPSASQAPPGPVTGRTLDDWWLWLLSCCGGSPPPRGAQWARAAAEDCLSARPLVRPAQAPCATTLTRMHPGGRAVPVAVKKELPKRSKQGRARPTGKDRAVRRGERLALPPVWLLCRTRTEDRARSRPSFRGSYPEPTGGWPGAAGQRPIACGISCLSKALNV